ADRHRGRRRGQDSGHECLHALQHRRRLGLNRGDLDSRICISGRSPFLAGTGKGIGPFRGVEGQPLRPIAYSRKRVTADESGATMLEYGLLLLFIALAVMAAAKLLGQNVLPLFEVTKYL